MDAAIIGVEIYGYIYMHTTHTHRRVSTAFVGGRFVMGKTLLVEGGLELRLEKKLHGIDF